MIDIKNLTKTYGDQQIFKNLSHSFPQSGLCCIFGASGCGKSTLLNMLAGFDCDYSGAVSVCGRKITDFSEKQLCDYRRDNVGFVFQSYNLIAGYTALENVLLAASNDAQNEAEALLLRLGIAGKAHEKVENLSGGQKQRVAIARALISAPQLILADEPTGALDRKNAGEIMELLKEISKDRLVLVITHDEKARAYADETLTISDGQLLPANCEEKSEREMRLLQRGTLPKRTFSRGIKNFSVHIKRYLAAALAISLGTLALTLSLSGGNVMNSEIESFKQKNTAFNNGYIKADERAQEAFLFLLSEPRVENVYKQHILKDVTLIAGEKKERLAEKYPMPKATENMSYGRMPKVGANEIALSPSLAKKFEANIKNLLGTELVLTFDKKEYPLTVSGIFNAGYDDFFVSADVEKRLNEGARAEELYSISYDVTEFSDIPATCAVLEGQSFKAETAAKEVSALQSSFLKLRRLFITLSFLMLAVGLFVSAVLLVKLQNSRLKEIGLLSALGFRKGEILRVLLTENLLLAALAAAANAALFGISVAAAALFKAELIITAPQLIFCAIGTAAAIVIIALVATRPLIKIAPATALR